MYQKPLYDITDVCRMIGTTSRTLRFYEEKGIIQSTTVGISLVERSPDFGSDIKKVKDFYRGEKMKRDKLLFVLLIIVLAFSLTSCKVNWFNQQYDVPWWVIAVPVIIFSVVVWFAAGKHIASKKYVCPKCNKTFYPKWWKAAGSIHMNDDRVFKCPHCGRKGFCHFSRDTDDRL